MDHPVRNHIGVLECAIPEFVQLQTVLVLGTSGLLGARVSKRHMTVATVIGQGVGRGFRLLETDNLVLVLANKSNKHM